MKTMYDIVEEKLVQSRLSGDKKGERQYEETLRKHTREIKDIVLEYDKADKIPIIDNKTIKFICFAENGACGSSGDMYIITKSLDKTHHYCFNCLDETPIENFNQLLPWLIPFLKKFDSYFPNPKMFCIHIKDWKHCYLGLGNHLFISDDVYYLFADDNISHLIDTQQYSKLQMCWKSKAETILGAINNAQV